MGGIAPRSVLEPMTHGALSLAIDNGDRVHRDHVLGLGHRLHPYQDVSGLVIPEQFRPGASITGSHSGRWWTT